MQLYSAPGFSSLADHIAMLEAGLEFDVIKIDIATKEIEGGGRYTDITPKGYVPALVFDDGEVLTENVAILAWVADRAPQLAPQGHLGRYRLLEMLSFIATEIHKRFPIYLSLSRRCQGANRPGHPALVPLHSGSIGKRASVRRDLHGRRSLSLPAGVGRDSARI